jgi:hypothetical protein
MTRFGSWKECIARIFGKRTPRARRRPRGSRCADLGISLESLESRELLSADAMLAAFAHFGSSGAAGHDLTFGRGPLRDFGRGFAFDRGGDRGFGHESSQSTNSTHLAFTVEPTDGTAGQSFTVTVSVEDANGNVVSGNTSNVTLRVADGPGDFSGGQTLSATASNGVATFNDVVLNTAGTYTLVAASEGAGRSYSNSFTIAPDTTDAGQLVFQTGSSQSGSHHHGCDGSDSSENSSTTSNTSSSAAITGTAGQPLTTFKVVEEDKFGNVITSDNSSTITIAVNTGSSSALDSKSTLTATVVNGVATFDNVILDTAGQYTLSATDSNSLYLAAVSNTITVSAASAT